MWIDDDHDDANVNAAKADSGFNKRKEKPI